MVVLIPEDGGDLQRVCLVDALWKTVTVIPNRRLTTAIGFNDNLHGFWVGRVMETSLLKSNTTQQLTAMKEVLLYKIFLDLQKAYGALDRDRCLDIMSGYGMSPWEIYLISK